MTRTTRRAWTLAGLGAVLVLPFALANAPQRVGPAEDQPPSPAEPVIADAVVATLENAHYRPKPIDDALAQAWFEAYVEGLDPARIYFNATDMAELRKLAPLLDDDLRARPPKLDTAWVVFDRYRERVRERVAFAKRLLAENAFTFDDPGAFVDLGREEDEPPWPADTAALDALWRPRVAAQVLEFELDGTPRAEALGRLDRRFARIQRDVDQTTRAEILEIFLAAFSTRFDPHSVWMKPATKAEFDIDMQDTLIGIGAVLNFDDGYTVIRELIAGGPAERSGLIHPGDRILEVAQGDEVPVDVVEMPLDDVVRLIRGKQGTVVKLTIRPATAVDPAERRVIELTRDKVKIADAAAKAEQRTLGGRRVGIIEVPSFYVDSEGRRSGAEDYGSTTRDVDRILTTFRNDGVEAVVIDLRANGGGSLDEAVSLTGLFLPGGSVVQIRDRKGDVDVLDDEDPRVSWTGPVIVLTSENSASASEIFAGALQDYGRAVVVGGSSTHGKGTVQNLLALAPFVGRSGLSRDPAVLDQLGSVKFTTHMFYRVSGASTQVRGVTSDIVLPSVWANVENRESDLDNPLPWSQIAPARHKPQPLGVNLDVLRAASRDRVARSMEFSFLLEDIAERDRNRENARVSLHLPTRQTERDHRKAVEGNRNVARGLPAEPPPDAELPDPILDEAVAIAVDVLAGLTVAGGSGRPVR